MSSVLLIVQYIGIVLLAILAVLLVLLLLVLLVPIRYRGEFSVEDPVPHEKAPWGDLSDRASGQIVVRWFGSLVRILVAFPAEQILDVRIAWIHPDVMAYLHREPGGGNRQSGGGEPSPRVGFCDKIRRMYRKADYYRRVLRKEETTYTIERMQHILVETLRRILPERWQITGTVGLGDPAATARILEAQGILYPFTAGHMVIAPVFQQYQMDLSGSLQGRIRLLHLLTALLSAATDRRIRQTMRRLRRADQAIAAHYRNTDQAAAQPENG